MLRFKEPPFTGNNTDKLPEFSLDIRVIRTSIFNVDFNS